MGVRYPCNQCEYSAAQPGSLKTHIQSIHARVRFPCAKEYQCDLCEYTATTVGDLTVHINQHFK